MIENQYFQYHVVWGDIEWRDTIASFDSLYKARKYIVLKVREHNRKQIENYYFIKDVYPDYKPSYYCIVNADRWVYSVGGECNGCYEIKREEIVAVKL